MVCRICNLDEMTLVDISAQTSRAVSPLSRIDKSSQTSRAVSPQMGKNLGNQWDKGNVLKTLGAMGLISGYGVYRANAQRKAMNANLVPKAQAPTQLYGPDRTYFEPKNVSNLSRYHTPTPTPEPTPIGAEPKNCSNLSRYHTPTPTPMEVTGTNPLNNITMSQP